MTAIHTRDDHAKFAYPSFARRSVRAAVPELPSRLPEVRVGYVALLDAAPLLVGVELGTFEKHGVRVRLHQELGWANIRDKLDHGQLEAVHTPAAVLPVQALSPTVARDPSRRLITAVAMGAGCNAITLSRGLWDRGVRDGASLAEEVRRRRGGTGGRRLRLGVVLSASSHNLLLRYWLAAHGIDPEVDVRISIVPPPLMGQLLMAGHLDGYCVGEPWNSLAVARNVGFVTAATIEIYPGHPEKVLAVREGWANAHPELHRALVRGLVEAAAWCDQASNRAVLVKILTARLGVETGLISAGLAGRFASDFTGKNVQSFAVFSAGNACFPFRSKLVWLITQLMRWRIISAEIDPLLLSRQLYRTELQRAWLSDLADFSVSLPSTDLRIERMFDGKELDPLRPERFLK